MLTAPLAQTREAGQAVRTLQRAAPVLEVLAAKAAKEARIAAALGKVAAVKVHGADAPPDEPATPQRNTALIWAARDGRKDILEVLLEGGADVHKANQAGVTALMTAAAGGWEPCVTLLINAGADPLASTASGRTAASYAQQGMNVATAADKPRFVAVLANSSPESSAGFPAAGAATPTAPRLSCNACDASNAAAGLQVHFARWWRHCARQSRSSAATLVETAGAEKEAFLHEAKDAGYLQLSRVQVFKLYRVNGDLAKYTTTLCNYA